MRFFLFVCLKMRYVYFATKINFNRFFKSFHYFICINIANKFALLCDKLGFKRYVEPRPHERHVYRETHFLT